MARRLIDISVPLQNDVPADPPGGHPTIQYIDHQQGLPRMLQFFQGLKAEGLPDGQGWAVEQVQLSTHNGTHLDAPWHFHPTMNRGERSWTIDEVPLEWCLQPGVKLDFRHLPDGYVATAEDVEAELKRIGHTLSPLEIVVVNTSAGAKYGRQDYVTSGCGMGYEATMYLLERGVRLTGIDGWSWDAPFVYTAKKYAETKDASLIWEGHKAGRHIGYCHIEKLHNLEQLPSTGFTVSCFPVKIERASAGWTRAVAILDGGSAYTPQPLPVYLRPHPEERPLGRVSKDGRNAGTRGHPSRRAQGRAPQDEVGENSLARNQLRAAIFQNFGNGVINTFQPDEFQFVAGALRDFIEVAPISRRQHHPAQAGSGGRDDFFLDAADRQHQAPQRYLARHPGVPPDR